MTREYGVNKIYDLTSFRNVTKTTTYYIGKHENTLYYVPVTEITNNEKEKIFLDKLIIIYLRKEFKSFSEIFLL